MIDVESAAERRRFYLGRAFRKNTRGSGSDLTTLMDGPAPNGAPMEERVLAGLPIVLAGAHAAAAYAPPRLTDDVDLLIEHERYADGEARLRAAGWHKDRDLGFSNTALGLYGGAWSKNAEQLVLIASPLRWAAESFRVTATDKRGRRVLPLAYLVLMKLDSARGVDQGDLSRMLGLLNDAQVEEIVRVVTRHYDDPQAADDIRQYAALGRWEWERP